MVTETGNEAAERLRIHLSNLTTERVYSVAWLDALDAALAAERRATVERMLAHYGLPGTEDSIADVYRTMGLDEETAR